MKNKRYKRPCKKDVVVSIILTESTTSLLKLNIPNIEETTESTGSTCVIKPVTKSDIRYSQESFLSYFFGKGKEIGKDSSEITSDVAYFSDTYKSDSDISVSSKDILLEEEDEELSVHKPDHELEAIKIFTRPLVTAKSIAHEDNINIEDNKIFVAILNDELRLVDSELICRICHGGESLGDLLRPCRCRGTIALTHIACLERWLKESSNSFCELCNHHFQIVRQPKYSVPWSVLIYLSHPGDNLKDILLDLIAFIVYTPSAFASTYMLMLICENIAKSQMHRTRNVSAHIVAFCAVFGMAAIDFTYSSWLIVTFQRHANAWRTWYRSNSFLKLMLPDWKKKPYRHLTNTKKTSTHSV